MVQSGTLTTDEHIHHFCQVDRATFTVTDFAPTDEFVTLAYSDPAADESSTMVVPREAFGRAAMAFLGVVQ